MLDLALFFVVDILDFGKDSGTVNINHVRDFLIKFVILDEIMQQSSCT